MCICIIVYLYVCIVRICILGRHAPVGKITVRRSFMSARCMLRPRCARPYGFGQLPHGDVLKQWLADGLRPEIRARERHMALPKPTRSR